LFFCFCFFPFLDGKAGKRDGSSGGELKKR